MSQHVASDPTTDFLHRWAHSGAAERANYHLFLSELCDVLGVPRPDPTVRTHDVREIAETLVSLGQARRVEDRYVV